MSQKIDNNSASKSSPKRSPKKSGSPSKKSPKSKSSPKSGKGKQPAIKEPPVEVEIQTQPTAVCYFCLRTFTNPTNIQSHILTMDHNSPYSSDLPNCRACQSTVMIKDVERHKCAGYKALFLQFVSDSTTLDNGPPYRCLYCRSEPMASRVSLALHLLCQHRPNKQPGKCGMCDFTYPETGPVAGGKGGRKGSPKGGKRSPSPKSKSPKKSPKSKSPKKSPKVGKRSPSPKGGKAGDKVEEEKVDQLALIAAEPLVTTPGLVALARHIEAEHQPGYTLLQLRQLSEDSYKRFPYACPICCCQMTSNYDLHAHILGCHANSTKLDSDLFLCAICGFAAANLSGLNQHVLAKHTSQLKALGQAWIKHQLMMNATDLANVCACCWQSFKHDFQLQAHLLVAHTSNHPLRCGWCKTDFLSCPDPILAMMLMQNHETNHALELQKVALEHNYTTAELEDPVPEVADKQVLINFRLNPPPSKKELEGQQKGKKKSPPGKKSPKSKSPKSSPKSKSPKSSKKSKK